MEMMWSMTNAKVNCIHIQPYIASGVMEHQLYFVPRQLSLTIKTKDSDNLMCLSIFHTQVPFLRGERSGECLMMAESNHLLCLIDSSYFVR